MIMRKEKRLPWEIGGRNGLSQEPSSPRLEEEEVFISSSFSSSQPQRPEYLETEPRTLV